MTAKKNILHGLLIIAGISLIFSVFFLIIQKHEIESLKYTQIFLAPGQKIRYFDLIGTDNRQINASHLNKNRLNLIFLFKQPCAPCNPNLSLWRRIAKILPEKVNIYGIWLGRYSDMFELQQDLNLGFTLYSPIDIKRFKDEFKISYNYAQTILYMNNAVSMVRLGNLEGYDYTTLLRLIKRYLNKSV